MRSGNALGAPPVPPSMDAENRTIRQNAHGGPEHITVEHGPVPVPGAGLALIRVHAAGLNPVDWKIAEDAELAEEFGVRVPGGYGHDLAGVVVALGEGAHDVRIGDRVVGGARGAAVADYALVPSDRLTLVPRAVPLTVAATLPIAARTATAAITALALGPSDTVLIGGAAGGVGVLATQLAVRTGATVLTTSSVANHDFLRQLGAVPLTYGAGLVDDIRARGFAPTAAADLHGEEVAHAALSLGVEPRRISTVATAHIPGTVATGGGGAPAGTIARVLDDLAAGRLHVEIAGEYPLERTADAVAVLRTGHVRGKIVITTGA